jgi:arylsulfatase A
MQRRQFLGMLSAAALAPAQTAPPNVILILLDDLGWRDFGCYGHKFHETPHIDQLAREGVMFTQSYAACCVCSPTRASIQTGKYPARLQLTDWIPGRKQWPSARVVTPAFEQQLPLAEKTIPEYLKQAGYRTASIGKWHLGGKGFSPLEQGYDVNIAGDHRGSPMSYFGPYDFVNMKSRADGESLTERLAEEAGNFIAECAAARKPFFVYLPHYAPHTPIREQPDRIAKYRAKGGAEERNNPTYAAMVERIDESLGALRRKLAALQVDRNTVIILTSDNGGLRYEGKSKFAIAENAPLRAGKGHQYEGGIRNPLIIHWPAGIRQARTVDTPVISQDLMPTVLALAGVAPPRDIDGVNLAPLLQGRATLKRDALYWHYPHYSNQGGVPAGAIREGRYKLIEFYEDSRVELFDLVNDPGEKTNLAAKDPARAKRLHAKLAGWRKQVNAAMPQPNPAYDATTADQGLTGAEPPTN